MHLIQKNTSHQTATFVILEPDVEDLNGDVISAHEIVKTAHEFMYNLENKTVNANHENGTDMRDVVFVESWISPVDLNL